MIKRFCDICEKEIKEEDIVYGVSIWRKRSENVGIEEEDCVEEICKECSVKIREFVKGLQKGE